jgi:CRISPR-associated protein Cmr1
MRSKPKISPPSVDLQTDPNIIQQVRHYRLITPLYGGGVEPNKADPISVVRGSEVRGHLRFWWRAMRGNQNGSTTEAMFQKEADIWGSAGGLGRGGPSKVIINIQNPDPGTAFQAENYRGQPIADIGDFRSKDSYVAFPLRNQNAVLREEVSFDLDISYPSEYRDDIDAALWAWQTFGGIGARTRRGFGALACEKINNKTYLFPSQTELKTLIQKHLKKYLSDKVFPRGVPHLSSGLNYKVLTFANNSAVDAWRVLIKKYQAFRQSRPGGNPRHPGRSHWPAPDVIRRKTGNHGQRHPPNHQVDNKIPRAKFGLPIIFQFNDRDDPDNTTLQGQDEIDRMASPLILRPVRCADGAAALAVILEWDPINKNGETYTPPGGLKLLCGQSSWAVKSDLQPIDINHIQPLRTWGEVDPLKAFIKSL